MDELTFKNIFPNNKNPKIWVPLLNELLPKYGINTNIRIAAFMSQCGHESSEFNRLIENLNYSRDGLLKVFPRYFNSSNVDNYARKPEKIANRVYASRMGNGSEISGDGWKYRGRGILQITGKTNYQNFASWIGDTNIILNPDLLITPKYALLSALWFWSTNNLNKIADTRDIKLLTKRINGGYNGLEHRTQLYNNIIGKL